MSSFFSHHPAPPELSTLSLHDALPISFSARRTKRARPSTDARSSVTPRLLVLSASQSRLRSRSSMPPSHGPRRSEEHTSELQSQSNLVCRLLLEKKKTTTKHSNSTATH